MKKYFVKETGDELEFGDIVSFTLCKELEDGSVTKEVECRLTPSMVKFLIELEIIECQEKEEEQEQSLIQFTWSHGDDYLDNIINTLCEDREKLEDRIEKLEKLILEQDNRTKGIKKALDACILRIDKAISNSSNKQ